VGLYQVNLIVPPAAGSGSQPVTIAINEFTSKSTSIIIQ
jgi:uncharacterized protein (TIGR03437 family)